MVMTSQTDGVFVREMPYVNERNSTGEAESSHRFEGNVVIFVFIEIALLRMCFQSVCPGV